MGPAHHHRAQLGEIEAPALVLWGQHDAAFPAPCALVAAAALQRGRAVVMGELGHSPHLQAPEETLEIVMAFLREAAPD
ncbi:MAG: alpha/beta hydrolase [Polyangiaceae bacterium]